MRFALVALPILLFFKISWTSDVNDEAEELVKYLFQNTRKLPRISSLPKSDRYPEIGLSPDGLINHYGYPAETHEVITDDGYILSLYRIPHGISNPLVRGARPVVFLMHGLLAASTCFLFNGVERSLGFILAEQGYDVWLGNARGTTYSRKHITMDPSDDKSNFWNFSWHEIGYYDIPASIDYVLEKTKQENLIYIGHSQGSTSFFVMTSERPEYNDKVKLMVAMAPVALLGNVPNSAAKELAKNMKILELITNAVNFYEVLPQWQIFSVIVEEYCMEGSPTQQKCIDLYKSAMGSSTEQLNATMIPIYFSYFPAGASIKQFYHYGQEINSEHFRKYDFGLLKNLMKYGRSTPPDYNLDNIVTPVALYYSSNDHLTSVTDVDELSTKLPNVVDKHLVEDETFSHTNFLTAVHINELLYDRIIALLRKY